MPLSLFSYKGGKTKSAHRILSRIDPSKSYVEPFVGAGSVFASVRARNPQIAAHINDVDSSIAACWLATRDYASLLIERIQALSAGKARDTFRNSQLTPKHLDFLPTSRRELVEVAAMKLFMQDHSFSGHGAKGGMKSRLWNVVSKARAVKEMSGRLKAVAVTNHDYKVIMQGVRAESYIFADPPYVAAGPGAYAHSFTPSDHIQLRDALKRTMADWWLTYGFDPSIQQLYNGWSLDREAVQNTSRSAHPKSDPVELRNGPRGGYAERRYLKQESPREHIGVRRGFIFCFRSIS